MERFCKEVSTMNIEKKTVTQEEVLDLSAIYSCGELADLWMLTGIETGDSGAMEMNWKHRAEVFERMIKLLSPKHAKYAEVK